MTTKEVAAALGVTPKTVCEVARKCGFENNAVSALGQDATWTEEQCTAISIRIHNPDRNQYCKGTDDNGAVIISPACTPVELHSTVRNAVRKMDIPNEVKAAADILSDLLGRFGAQSRELDEVKERLARSEEQARQIASDRDAKQEQVEKLEIELDRSEKYATVKRIKELNPELNEKTCWRSLRAWCLRGGQDLRKTVFDANYGTVKAYPKECWMEVYPDLNYPEEW